MGGITSHRWSSNRSSCYKLARIEPHSSKRWTAYTKYIASDLSHAAVNIYVIGAVRMMRLDHAKRITHSPVHYCLRATCQFISLHLVFVRIGGFYSRLKTLCTCLNLYRRNSKIHATSRIRRTKVAAATAANVIC